MCVLARIRLQDACTSKKVRFARIYAYMRAACGWMDAHNADEHGHTFPGLGSRGFVNSGWLGVSLVTPLQARQVRTRRCVCQNRAAFSQDATYMARWAARPPHLRTPKPRSRAQTPPHCVRAPPVLQCAKYICRAWRAHARRVKVAQPSTFPSSYAERQYRRSAAAL
jgi:hypothetical protein